MGIFDQIGKKITDVSQDAVKKTKDLTEIAKLNSQISNEENTIKNNYMLIGKKYYELFKDTQDDGFAPLCTAITNSLQKIDVRKAEIQKIKGIQACPKCGTAIAADAIFCSVCGYTAGAAEENAPPASAEKTCPKCGGSISQGAIFCGNCGTKLE